MNDVAVEVAKEYMAMAEVIVPGELFLDYLPSAAISMDLSEAGSSAGWIGYGGTYGRCLSPPESKGLTAL